MSNEFAHFDAAFASPVAAPLRRRKTIRQCLVYYAANLLVMPLIALVYAAVIAEGIALLAPLFQRKIYSLPIPGAGLLRRYDGFDRFQLSTLAALALFIAITWLWYRIFVELQGCGTLAGLRRRSPFAFYLLAGLTGVFIGLDALLFYVGLASQTSSGWSGAPAYVVPAATIFFVSGAALCGAFHADHHTSNTI